MPFTDQDRQRAWANSQTQRRKQQQQRRKQAKKMADAGMPKTAIAEALGVHLKTIYRDLKEAEQEKGQCANTALVNTH